MRIKELELTDGECIFVSAGDLTLEISYSKKELTTNLKKYPTHKLEFLVEVDPNIKFSGVGYCKLRGRSGT